MTIQGEAKLLASKIAQVCRPEKIIVFGSVAREEAYGDADIDLLVVKKSTKKRPYRVKEIFEAVRGVKRNYPLDAIVYTPDEIKKRLSLGDYFVQKILKEGKVLYG